MFSKNDLKTGMWVITKNNEEAIVFKDTEQGDIISGETWFPLDEYSDKELFGVHGEIIEILQPTTNRDFYNFNRGNCYIVWSRANLIKDKERLLLKIEEIDKLLE